MIRTIAYGPGPQQDGDLHLPDGPGPFPVVVLWHGGGFAAGYGRGMLDPSARDLAARGVAAWNVTYRREGSGGGWPATFDDARDALESLVDADAPLDLDDVTALGFSAGMPVALHAARVADGPVAVRRFVNLAGVASLALAGSNADLPMGRVLAGADLRAIDPMALVPLGVPSLTVHGAADELVPVAVGEAWAAAAQDAEDRAQLVVVPGAGHFDLHLPGGAGWTAVLDWLGLA